MTTSKLEFPNVPQVRARILINGVIKSEGFATREVYSNCHRVDNQQKATLLGETPDVTPEVLLSAVEAADRAWENGRGDWPTSTMEHRISAVTAFRNRMIEQREMICRTLMWEIGKPWADAQNEFDRTILYINDTIEEAKKLDRDSSQFRFAGDVMAQIRRAPLGVTLCLGPYNYPLNETFTTLIPALIMGNPVVAKTPRYGQLFWDYMLEGFRDCFPPGVVNVVSGRGRDIVQPAISSGKVGVLAFIGSSRVAGQIKRAHPLPNRLRSILSLDAKNPAIILPDADLSVTVAECVRGTLSFNGQRCTALKILFVHRDIAKTFVSAFTAAVDGLVRGMPWAPKVQITPLPDADRIQHLMGWVDEAISKGATLVSAVREPKVVGSLMHPIVLSHVPLDCKLATEEQFGPVVPICVFDSIDQVEDYILKSNFGMQASIFGSDPHVVGELIDRLSNQVCRINLNTQCQRGPDVFPFTGRKDSAEGTLRVYDALRSFSIRSMVAAKQDANGKRIVRGVLDAESSRFLSTKFVL